MPDFIEQNCSIALGGRTCTSGGAMAVGDRFIGYLKAQPDGKYAITDWHGNVLTDTVRVTNVIRVPNGILSNKLYYLRFRYDGKVYSGTSGGNAMAVRAKLTKSKKL